VESRPFRLGSPLTPCGDQPAAIAALVKGVEASRTWQTLLGVTGSGKTFTVAKVIEATQRPALVLAPNKTLAAQLFEEFRELFPDNAVEYFVSYYDYYQPEAYVPSSDTYIAKDAAINDRIDRMRHAATNSLLTRRDVIIVCSVSCIYGLGSPDSYGDLRVEIKRGASLDRDDLLRRLVQIQYSRNDISPQRGTFRARGDLVEIFPASSDDRVVRVEFFGDEVETLAEVDLLTGAVIEEPTEVAVFPSSHFVTPRDRLVKAVEGIEAELEARLLELRGVGKLLEAQRLEMRTRLDVELMTETGICPGIENYSRHLDGRGPGEPPATLIDYFPSGFLTFIDESHVTLPQLGGMFRGDRARKETLVEHGFRLPSAIDNRPLKFEEWEKRVEQVVCVSATPADEELRRSGGVTGEQVIRPTGLVDPRVEIRPARGQVDDLLGEIRAVTAKGFRTLVTSLTKRMAEDLSTYFREVGVRVKFLHSDVETLERMAILRSLRLGEFDVLVGVNLLREGLDLPEVALVAVLDADKEGFLRSHRSLIQTIGRAARNVEGRAILYADRETESIKKAVDETRRRRVLQEAYNLEHGITPQTIKKRIAELMDSIYEKDYVTVDVDLGKTEGAHPDSVEATEREAAVLRKKMLVAAKERRYEEAAALRDRVRELERRLLKS
jgi:excinuclease ABC subunit B